MRASWRRYAAVLVPLVALVAAQLYWAERRLRFAREVRHDMADLERALQGGGLTGQQAGEVKATTLTLLSHVEQLVTDAYYATVLGAAFPILLGIALLAGAGQRSGSKASPEATPKGRDEAV